jgi:hypothetical protein
VKLTRSALAIVMLSGIVPVLARGPAPAALQERSAFLLAVLSRDGYAMPFASFDGRRWRSPWPSGRNVEMPITMDDVDESWWGIGKRPARMTLWAEGAKVTEVALTRLAVVKSLCSTRLGIQTDYKPRELTPPRMKQPYPKDGLLAAGDITVAPIDIVDRGSADWNRALILITDKFNKLETDATRTFEAWRHPFDAKARRLQPITVEAVYRAPNQEAGWTTYFVEAVRNYPARPRDRGCGLVTTGQGWVHVGPNERDAKVEFTARITYCDRKGVGFMLPLGLVRAGNRTHWVYQFSGFEGEWYQVVDTDKDGVKSVAGFHAGSCPE